jgi:hypothetical protein
MVIWGISFPLGNYMLWAFGTFMVIRYIFGHLAYFVAIWYILWQFGIFCGNLVYFVAIWYKFCNAPPR